MYTCPVFVYTYVIYICTLFSQKERENASERAEHVHFTCEHGRGVRGENSRLPKRPPEDDMPGCNPLIGDVQLT